MRSLPKLSRDQRNAVRTKISSVYAAESIIECLGSADAINYRTDALFAFDVETVPTEHEAGREVSSCLLKRHTF